MIEEKTVSRAMDKLYITDAELIRRLGVPEDKARTAIRALDHDRKSGFPPKQKLWGDRRYWPALRDYFDKANGLNIASPQRKERA